MIMNKKMKALMERFSNHLYARCGLSAGSVDLFTGYIQRMLQAGGAAHPSKEDLERYITQFRLRGASYAHVSNLINSIEHFMKFLEDPIRFQRPHRPRKAHMDVLSEGKITLILHAAKTLREKAMIMLLAYSGCRNHELTDLRICDIDIAQQSVTIQEGKGAKGRICPISGEGIETLMEYLRKRDGGPNDYLFITIRHSHKLQTQDVRKILRVVAKKAEIPGRVWPHLLRHSLATAMLNRGASIYTIQAILGHTYVSTTMEYYLHPGTRNVRADYQRCAPSFL